MQKIFGVIMTKDEALKDLLKIVEHAIEIGDWKVDGRCDPDLAINRAKEALEQPAQEPILPFQRWSKESDIINQEGFDRLNTHPTPEQNEFAKTKSWQGLSDDEIQEELKKMWDKGLIPSYSIVAFARAIEQELKRKNGFNDVKEKNA